MFLSSDRLVPISSLCLILLRGLFLLSGVKWNIQISQRAGQFSKNKLCAFFHTLFFYSQDEFQLCAMQRELDRDILCFCDSIGKQRKEKTMEIFPAGVFDTLITGRLGGNLRMLKFPEEAFHTKLVFPFGNTKVLEANASSFFFLALSSLNSCRLLLFFPPPL